MRRELAVARDPGYRWVDLLDPEPAELEALAHELDFPATVVHGGHFPSFGRERLRALAQAFLDAKGA